MSNNNRPAETVLVGRRGCFKVYRSNAGYHFWKPDDKPGLTLDEIEVLAALCREVVQVERARERGARSK